MTIGELKEKLASLPNDAKVLIIDSEYGYCKSIIIEKSINAHGEKIVTIEGE